MFNLFKTKTGGIAIVLLWSIVFFIIILVCVFIIEVYFMNVKAEIAKDATTMAAFSVHKNISIDELKRGDIEVDKDLKDTFKAYLAKNMNLDNHLVAKSNSVAVGKVSIETFEIYEKHDTQKYYPNGQNINYKPSLFVKIKFDVEPILKGILGNKKTVYTSATANLIYDKK